MARRDEGLAKGSDHCHCVNPYNLMCGQKVSGFLNAHGPIEDDESRGGVYDLHEHNEYGSIRQSIEAKL